MSKEELLAIVKKNLDELGIPYEETPGGLGDQFFLRPEEFDFLDEEPFHVYERILTTNNQDVKRHYQPQTRVRYDHIWNEALSLGEYGMILSVA